MSCFFCHRLRLVEKIVDYFFNKNTKKTKRLSVTGGIMLFIVIILLVLIMPERPIEARSLPPNADIIDIQAAIQEQGASWVAEETRISQLPDAELLRLCGVKVKPFLQEPITLPREAVPDRLDWREKNGVTSVKDQNGCGSCWAFAGIATLESLLRLNELGNFDLAEQFLLACSEGDCNGWYVEDTANFLRDKGTILEAEFPYSGTDSTPCPVAYNRLFKLTKWEIVTDWDNNNELNLIPAIALSPVATVMKVYKDFTYYKSGIYQHVSGGVLGWHAIELIGYDKPDGYFIAKNSWGMDWGEDGFFRIKFQDSSFGLATQLYFIDSQPAVTIRNKLTFTWGKMKNRL